jgi:hypothetical protein
MQESIYRASPKGADQAAFAHAVKAPAPSLSLRGFYVCVPSVARVASVLCALGLIRPARECCRPDWSRRRPEGVK